MLQFIGSPTSKSTNSNLNTLLELMGNNRCRMSLVINDLSEEQKKILYEIKLQKSGMSKCKNWLEVIDMFSRFYTGGFLQLEEEISRSILSRAIINATDNDFIITSSREEITRITHRGNDKDLKLKLLDNTKLAEDLKLNYTRKDKNTSCAYEKWLQEVVYAHRMYKLIIHQHYYPTERLAKLEIINGGVKIIYRDITKYNFKEKLKNTKDSYFDNTDTNTGGMQALLKEYPQIIKDCKLTYNIINDEISEVFVYLGIPTYLKENYNIVLSVLNLPEIVDVFDTLLVRYPQIQEPKYLLEEVVTNIIYHNFNKELKTNISIYKGGVVGFSVI